MSYSAWLGLLASLLYLIRLVPQPIRTLRTGQVAGVSGLAALNTLISDGAWLCYGLVAAVVPVWLVSIPAIAASALTVALLRRTIGRGDLAVASLWAALVVACAAGGVLTLALAATVLVTCGPALWSAYSHRHPVGLSRSTWWLAIADALAWGSYGVAIGDRALELYGVVQLLTAVAILVRLRAVSARLAPEAAGT